MNEKLKISLLAITLSLWIVAGVFVHSAWANENFAVEIVDSTIEVSVGFDGSTIEIFGDRQNPRADLVIMVEGPHKDITIWKKERILGAWVNRYYMTFKDMPIYYNYASTVMSKGNKLKALFYNKRIGHEALFASLQTRGAIENDEVYKKALLEQKRKQGVYFDKPAKINFISDHLFRVSFDVPPSAQTGDYKIHSFLIENGRVTQEKVDALKVKQVGVNALVVYEAKKHSVRYAFIVIILALFSGWFASIVKVRP